VTISHVFPSPHFIHAEKHILSHALNK